MWPSPCAPSTAPAWRHSEENSLRLKAIPMKPFLYSLFVVLCLSPLLRARPVVPPTKDRPAVASALAMPKQCQPGKTSPEALGWRLSANTPVRVYYLKDNFTAAEKDALARAVNNWNAALEEIDSG